MLDYVEDTTLSAVKMDVSAMEANLAKLEQQEQKYTAELDAALAEYSELKAQAADFDSDELAMAQLEIRSQKEASAESKIQAAYGDKYDLTPIHHGTPETQRTGEGTDQSGTEAGKKEAKRSWMGAVIAAPILLKNFGYLQVKAERQ